MTINAVPGSNTNLPIDTIVQLDNQNSGGEITYTWSILDQPPGAADALSSVSVQNPFFTPKKEGSYLIRLIVNQGLPTEQEDRVIAAIQQVKTLERIPAAGETTEADSSDGWATATNSYLRRIDTLLGDPGVFVGVNASGGVLTRGDVCRATASSVIKTGLPGQEIVPGFSKALATALASVDEPLVVCDGAVSGAPSVANGGLMKVRFLGRYAGNTGGVAAVGDPIYVSDTGTMSLTPGTVKRKLGSAMTAGATYDVWFAGMGGEDITPIDRAYLVYGPLSTLTNGHRVDGNNANPGASGGLPYLFKAADINTTPLVARLFAGSTQDIQKWEDSGGTSQLRVKSNGDLAWSNWEARQISASEFRLFDTDGSALTRYFRFVAQTAGAPPNMALEFIGNGADLHPSFHIEFGAYSGAAVRLRLPNDTGLRIHLNGTDSWLFSSFGFGNNADLIAPASFVSGVTGVRAPAFGAFSELARKSYVDSANNPNRVINGHFRYWQRGTSATIAAGNRAYVADRWYATHPAGAGGSGTFNQQTVTGPPHNFRYAARLDRGVTDITTFPRGIYQEIDREFIKQLRSSPSGAAPTLTVQFWARAGTGFTGTFNAEIKSDTGSGLENENAFVGYTGGIATSASGNFALTTSWQRFSYTFSSVTMLNVAALFFKHTPAALNVGNDWFEITGVQLIEAPSVVGTHDLIASDIPWRGCAYTEAGELEACQRYYEKSYDVDVAPASASTNGVERLAFMTNGGSPDKWVPAFRYKTRKRPGAASYLTCQTYSPFTGAAANGEQYNGGGDIALGGPAEGGETGFSVDVSAAAAVGDSIRVHWTVDVDI